MAAIIELELPTEEFALEETLTTVQEVQVEIERVVADNPDYITPYVWAPPMTLMHSKSPLKMIQLSKVLLYYPRWIRNDRIE